MVQMGWFQFVKCGKENKAGGIIAIFPEKIANLNTAYKWEILEGCLDHRYTIK